MLVPDWEAPKFSSGAVLVIVESVEVVVPATHHCVAVAFFVVLVVLTVKSRCRECLEISFVVLGLFVVFAVVDFCSSEGFSLLSTMAGGALIAVLAEVGSL